MTNMSTNTMGSVSEIEITFDKQLNGYDKEQVDRYVANLAAAYRTAYDEYTATCEKYNELLEKYQNLEKKGDARLDTDTVSKILINAEILARKTVEDAKEEAAQLKAEAQAESKKIKDAAYEAAEAEKNHAKKLLEDASVEVAAAQETTKKVIRDLMEEANSGIAEAQETANTIIRDAQAEELQIRTCLRKEREKANEEIRQIINKFQSLFLTGPEM